MAFRKTYRYFTLQNQKSGIIRRLKRAKSGMKPYVIRIKKEQDKLKKVNEELKKL